MRPVKLVIIEDLPEHASDLAALVRAATPSAYELHVQTYSDETLFRTQLALGHMPDIVLMDIELNEHTHGAGIALANELNRVSPATQIIYVTGHVEYCTAVYRTNHAYFLTKPVKREELADALKKAIAAVKEHFNENLSVSFAGTQTILPTSTISHIESFGRKASVHGASGTYNTYSKLSELLEHLPSPFIQCHKSHIVNLDHVVRMANDVLTLNTGVEVPIGKTHSKEVRAAWNRRLLGRL